LPSPSADSNRPQLAGGEIQLAQNNNVATILIRIKESDSIALGVSNIYKPGTSNIGAGIVCEKHPLGKLLLTLSAWTDTNSYSLAVYLKIPVHFQHPNRRVQNMQLPHPSTYYHYVSSTILLLQL
jgi:hypothetical protein